MSKQKNSRRDFFNRFLNASQDPVAENSTSKLDSKKIKMLTPDGKLVEVESTSIIPKKKAEKTSTNAEILAWTKAVKK